MRRARRVALVGAVAVVLARPVKAHAGGLSGETTAAAVPSWLVVLAGGVVVGGSFLFVSLLTDQEAIAAINAAGFSIGGRFLLGVRPVIQTGSILALLGVVVTALLGSPYPTRNPAIVWVWGGWWAGFTITVYLVANVWPVINPWRAMSSALASGSQLVQSSVGIPERGSHTVSPRLATYGSVGGLLLLVWLEVVTPVASNPRSLGLVVLAYTAVTLSGAWVYGDEWFRLVDPIGRVFRTFGRLAPVQWSASGLVLKLPSTTLTRGPTGVPGETAFVIALLWATTFDGVVSTPVWRSVVTTLIGGVPIVAPMVYLIVVVGGFVVFQQGYRVAADRARTDADSFLTSQTIERCFAPALVPIAAGYHLAHYLGFFLSLSPALLAVLKRPLATPGAFPTLVLPAWFGNAQLAFVVIGHLVGVYVAHSISFEVFPGALAPIRSQYPFVAVMVAYTMIAIWILTQPYVTPPFV